MALTKARLPKYDFPVQGDGGGGGGKTYRAIWGGGTVLYCRVRPPEPVLEASEREIRLVCVPFLQGN